MMMIWSLALLVQTAVAADAGNFSSPEDADYAGRMVEAFTAPTARPRRLHCSRI
jgi:hypothetical protein